MLLLLIQAILLVLYLRHEALLLVCTFNHLVAWLVSILLRTLPFALHIKEASLWIAHKYVIELWIIEATMVHTIWYYIFTEKIDLLVALLLFTR